MLLEEITINIIIYSAIFFFTLGFVAFRDLDKHKIPDVLVAILYLCLFFTAGSNLLDVLITFANIGFGFASLFVVVVFLDVLSELITRKNFGNYVLSWGDILIFPLVFAFSFNLFGNLGQVVSVVMLCLSVVVSGYAKRRVPVVPFLASGFVVAGIIMVVLSYLKL